MVSVSGIRGVVGASLTVPVLVDYAAAFGRFLPPGPVVVGRDARPAARGCSTSSRRPCAGWAAT
jgi:phosphomannomutase